MDFKPFIIPDRTGFRCACGSGDLEILIMDHGARLLCKVCGNYCDFITEGVMHTGESDDGSTR